MYYINMEKISVHPSLKEIIKKLNSYFKTKKEVVFVFLFGSFVHNNIHKNSDVDIGIYFYPQKNNIEVESSTKYKTENEIWLDVERILKREVDLIVLNRASSKICFSALRGIPVIIKDWKLYLKFMAIVSDEGINYQQMVISEFKNTL